MFPYSVVFFFFFLGQSFRIHDGRARKTNAKPVVDPVAISV